ncbi:MAG: GTPase Era [Acidimicrobiales bacterium]
MLIYELNDLGGITLPEGDFDTVGGLVFDLFGRVPVEGETASVDGVTLRVDRVQGRRITRVHIARIDDEPSIEKNDHRPTSFGLCSGFVTLLGRPNTGKSTLLNQMIGTKVTITSDKPQTTRHQICGVLNRDDFQIVFVDTPGIGKPRSAGREAQSDGRRSEAGESTSCVSWSMAIVVTAPATPIWLRISTQPTPLSCSTNATASTRKRSLRSLVDCPSSTTSAYFPISASTGKGVPELVEHLASRMPEGPMWYPDDQIGDVDESQWVAELVREQLLRVTHDEVPHSVAARVTDYDWPHIRVEILVERESQKGIVIGKKGAVLKEVGSKARAQLPKGTFLELVVTVDANWQHDPAAVERLGY